jgi:hypothetical protein
VVGNVVDAACFLTYLIQQKSWQVIKLDVDKLLEPKEWGWRFMGADFRLPNGQIVECYIVFAAMDLCKKQTNHLEFEKWRNLDRREMDAGMLAKLVEAQKQSTVLYDTAFAETLEDTTRLEFEALFQAFEGSKDKLAKEVYTTVMHDIFMIEKQNSERMKLGGGGDANSSTSSVSGMKSSSGRHAKPLGARSGRFGNKLSSNSSSSGGGSRSMSSMSSSSSSVSNKSRNFTQHNRMAGVRAQQEAQQQAGSSRNSVGAELAIDPTTNPMYSAKATTHMDVEFFGEQESGQESGQESAAQRYDPALHSENSIRRFGAFEHSDDAGEV